MTLTPDELKEMQRRHHIMAQQFWKAVGGRWPLLSRSKPEKKVPPRAEPWPSVHQRLRSEFDRMRTGIVGQGTIPLDHPKPRRAVTVRSAVSLPVEVTLSALTGGRREERPGQQLASPRASG